MFLLAHVCAPAAWAAKHHKLSHAKASPAKSHIKAHPKIPAPPSPASIAAADMHDGDDALSSGDAQTAVIKYQLAAGVAAGAHLSAVAASADAKMGDGYLSEGDAAQAIDALTRSQAALAQAGMAGSALAAKVWTVLAQAYGAHGDYAKAESCAVSGLPIYDRLLATAPTGTQPAGSAAGTAVDTPSELAQDAARLAFSAGAGDMLLGDYAQAQSRFRQSLAYVDKAGQSGTLMEADSMAAVADADVQLQQWHDATGWDDQALAIYVKLNSINGQKTALADRAAAYQALDDYPDAAASYASLLEIDSSQDDTRGIARIAPLLGFDDLQTRQYTQAHAAYAQAAGAASKLGDTGALAKAQLGMAVATESTGNYAGAIAEYNTALPVCEQSGDNADAAAALLNLGGAYEQFGQYQSALDAYDRSADFFTKAGDAKSAAVATQKAQGVAAEMVAGQ